MEKGKASEKKCEVIFFITVASVLIVLVVKLMSAPTISASLLSSIVLMTFLLLLGLRVFDIKSIILNEKGFQATMEVFRNQLSETSQRIEHLFMHTMSPEMYKNLAKLEKGNFGDYKMSVGLKRELYHLRDIGYIEVKSIREIPSSGKNLSDYIKITEAGKEFVKLRESIE